MTNYTIGDARPDINMTVRSKAGAVVDLTGSSAVMKVRKVPDAGEIVSSNKIDEAAVAVNLTTGLPHYTWAPAILDFAAGDEGEYKYWLFITLSDSDPITTRDRPLTVKPNEN